MSPALYVLILFGSIALSLFVSMVLPVVVGQWWSERKRGE